MALCLCRFASGLGTADTGMGRVRARRRRARPDLRIVGINANTSAVTVLAGQVYLAKSVDDVIVHLQAAEARKEAPIADR